jgi:hypothetical protein
MTTISSAALDDDYPRVTRRRARLLIAILAALLAADIASVVAVLFWH